MKNNKLPGGLWPVMLTPFHENNRIDSTALEELVNFYINAGASGLFANCLSSEMFQLTDEERLSIIRTSVKSAKGKVPVVASGNFGKNIHQWADFIKKVFQEGVAAVVLISNQIVTVHDEDELFKKRIDSLLSLTPDIPLGMYECPDPFKKLISPEMMHWLGKTGRFLYHKDTCCDPVAIEKKLESIKNTSLAFYNANTTTALFSLKKGGNGISPIGANFYPELYAYLCSAFREKGETPELADLNSQLDMLDAIADQQYPLSAKYFLHERGLTINPISRIPAQVINPESQMKLKALKKIFDSLKEVYTFKPGFAHPSV